MLTDPIADFATRVRNCLSIEAAHVDVADSAFKRKIAATLQREGFIWDYECIPNACGMFSVLRMNLKYGPSGERVVRSIKRVSSPGRRVYYGYDRMPRVLGGLGILVLSTNQGVLSSREAVSRRLGGEALLEVW